MGRYLNPGMESFEKSVNSEIYVDKTGLVGYTNRVMNTVQGYVCVSRPRRFGKSMAANMLTAEAVIPEKYFPNLKYPRVLILKSTEISIIPFF